MADLRKISRAVSVAIVFVIITASTTAKQTNPLDPVWNAIYELQQKVSDLIQQDNNQQQQIIDLQLQVSNLKSRLDQFEKGLLVYYNFDEGSGNEVKDSIRNNIGNIYGATWTEGKFGNALDFDGVDDYVQGSDSIFPEGNSPRTVSLWAKPIYDDKYHIAFVYGTMEYNKVTALMINGFDSDEIYSNRWTVSQHGSGIYSDTKQISDVWIFVAFTFDGNTYKLYENAVLTGSGTMVTNTVLNNFYMGKYADESAYFNGIIDEVKIYNRALTPEEIQEQYENP
jgi:hypothetical protein